LPVHLLVRGAPLDPAAWAPGTQAVGSESRAAG